MKNEIRRITLAFLTFLFVGVVVALVNYNKVMPWKAIPGVLILCCIGLAASVLAKRIPVKLPSVAYAGVIAIILTLPGFPGSKWIVAEVSKLDFILIATVVVGYAGIGLGNDVVKLAKDSWKYVIITLFLLVGEYFLSAIIAQIVLSLSHQI